MNLILIIYFYGDSFMVNVLICHNLMKLLFIAEMMRELFRVMRYKFTGKRAEDSLVRLRWIFTATLIRDR